MEAGWESNQKRVSARCTAGSNPPGLRGRRRGRGCDCTPAAALAAAERAAADPGRLLLPLLAVEDWLRSSLLPCPILCVQYSREQAPGNVRRGGGHSAIRDQHAHRCCCCCCLTLRSTSSVLGDAVESAGRELRADADNPVESRPAGSAALHTT